MNLILASASPRRAEILSAAGIPFQALPAETDETPRPGEDAETLVRRLAEAKMQAAASKLGANAGPAMVLGADTTVELDGELFGKPESADEARRMLERLSGRRHRVITGVAVMRLPDRIARFAVVSTGVWFTELQPEEIRHYAATGEPYGKAGGYAIQGIAGRYVERIEGCYFNVVGLPLAAVYRLLKELGWQDAG